MNKRKSVTIGIEYPGACISVNHYRGRTRDGGEYVRADARIWMEELGWVVKFQHLECWRLPLEVSCSGRFRDQHSAPDLSNLSKCTLDAIEEATGINDRDMRWRDGERKFSRADLPELYITIKEAPDAG